MPISDFIFSSSSSSSTSSNSRWRSPTEWVEYYTRKLERGASVDVDAVRICVFQVPKTISDLNPEAYAPQEIGLGPYHHLRQHLYDKMESRKLDAVHTIRFLDEPIQDLWPTLLLELEREECIIRKFYDTYLDIHSNVLKYLLAIDNSFLLLHLRGYQNHQLITPALRKSAEDILMMENQIPFALLRPIEKLFRPSSDIPIPIPDRQVLFSYQFQRETKFRLTDSSVVFKQRDPLGDEDWLYLSVVDFCYHHSPFKFFAEKHGAWLYANSDHLLDFMYKLTVNNYRLRTGGTGKPTIGALENFLRAAELVLSLVGLHSALKFLRFVTNLPWNPILCLFRNFSFYKWRDIRKTARLRKIKIPSASVLHKVGGVRFEATALGIQEIHFSREQRILQVPLIKLESDSEVILRNLVAYEASSGSAVLRTGNRIADYIDLLCGIIRNPDDVRVLRDNNVVSADMSDDEILKILEGIGETTGESTVNYSLQKTINDINQHFDSRPRVMAKRLTKEFVYGLWNLLVIFSSVLIILQLCAKAFCKVYGSTPFLEKLGPDTYLL